MLWGGGRKSESHKKVPPPFSLFFPEMPNSNPFLPHTRNPEYLLIRVRSLSFPCFKDFFCLSLFQSGGGEFGENLLVVRFSFLLPPQKKRFSWQITFSVGGKERNRLKSKTFIWTPDERESGVT